MSWPSVDEQMAQDKVIPGSALDKLIRDNQDFLMLRAVEAADNIGVPPWLRIYWRKQHPDGNYAADDPAGGYPRFLPNVYAWMQTHQDLQLEPLPAPVTVVEVSLEQAPEVAVPAGGNLRISGAQSTPRSESDIRVNPSDPKKIVAASNSIRSSRQAQFYSSDGGLTWHQTTLPLASGDSLHSGPAVGWLSDGTAWATTLGIDVSTMDSRVRAYRSSDGGKTWSFDGTVSRSQTAADKARMCVDDSDHSTYKDQIYVIWQNDQAVYVNWRYGLEGAWRRPIRVSGSETTGTGIGGDIQVNSGGVVFAFWHDTGSRKLLVAKSWDGGNSFFPPVTIAATFASNDIGVPAFASHRAPIYVSGGAYYNRNAISPDPKDFVYAIWTDLTGVSGCANSTDEPGTNGASPCRSRIWFSRSTDGGATWSRARMINNQPTRNDQFNPRLAVDNSYHPYRETQGRLVVIYYDTVRDAGRRKTDVWCQTSSDHGATWSAPVKITTARTDETGSGADTGNQYGDYNGLSGHGELFFPTWTDRRNDAFEEIWTVPINVTLAQPAATIPAVLHMMMR